MPTDMNAILETEGILPTDKDFRLMTRTELAALFAAKRSGRIILSRLIKNIIWQAHGRIAAGEEEPVYGNIRTFWYRWVKPVLAHIPDDDQVKTDPYDTMLKVLAEMVLDLKLLRYDDFDFTDENWENRRVGTSKPEVLVFSEKTGWFRFLRELHEEFGVSVLALGGAPSALTSEYTARHIGKTLEEAKKERRLCLIGIVDYDPSGDIIAKSFKDQLEAAGLPASSLTTVIHPEHYSQVEIEIFKFPLPKRQKTKTANWLARTGGIAGETFGLESESMPRGRLRAVIRDIVLAEEPPATENA